MLQLGPLWNRQLRVGGPPTSADAPGAAACSSTPVFFAALLAQAAVLATFFASDIGFLWYNVIGCAGVVVFTFALQAVLPKAVPR